MMFAKNIDKVKKNFTVDYAKDRFETVHNFALETTERFFSKGIDTLEKWQDATDRKIKKGFKKSAKIQDKALTYLEEKLAPRITKIKNKLTTN
ncbi:MAG: hypothetical protein HRT70_07845 [Flavobacteriaceae bacterium]|nr:hypothetical protein [Flavobacteriaceae bacterium]